MMPFHTVHGVLKARILKWFAIPVSSGPHSVRNVEIEENNKMEKTRDLFKKLRDIKGTFHAKMGSVKDRNDMDLTEAEDSKKKRWQEKKAKYLFMAIK